MPDRSVAPPARLSIRSSTDIGQDETAREVVGDAGLLFDPEDIEALRDALLRVAESSTLREHLIRRGHAQRALFSWQLCVEQTLAIYRSGEGHKPVASEDTGWQAGEQRG